MTGSGSANRTAIAVVQKRHADCGRNRNPAARSDDGCGQIPFAPLSVVLGTFALGIWILIHRDDDGNRAAAHGMLGGIFPEMAVPISPA